MGSLRQHNDREKMGLAGHVADTLHVTSVAMPSHRQHRSLPSDEAGRLVVQAMISCISTLDIAQKKCPPLVAHHVSNDMRVGLVLPDAVILIGT